MKYTHKDSGFTRNLQTVSVSHQQKLNCGSIPTCENIKYKLPNILILQYSSKTW